MADDFDAEMERIEREERRLATKYEKLQHIDVLALAGVKEERKNENLKRRV